MMTILRMLTGVFAVAAGVFGRRRTPGARAEKRWKRSLDETRATTRRRAACCEPAGFLDPEPSAPPDAVALKLRRAAAWHGKVALRCRDAGDDAGRREHSAHAARYLDAFRRMEAGNPGPELGAARAAVSENRMAAVATPAGTARVRVQCPKCLVRQEYEILMSPDRFRYTCRDRNCEGSEEAWGWDQSFCEVVRPGVWEFSRQEPQDGALQELVCNAVDPPPAGCGSLPPDDGKVWVTGKGDKIRPADMNNGHLVNTIRYIERKARDARRSRAAGRPHGRGYAPLEGFIGSRLPVYQEMLREADRRGLKHE